MNLRAEKRAIRRRAVALAGIVTLHVAIFGALNRSRPITFQPTVTAIRIHEVAPSEELQPVENSAPLDVVITAPRIEIAEPRAPVAPTCTIADSLGAAFANDPDTVAALAPLSVASVHAKMVWNGHWVDSAAAAPLRKVTLAMLATEPPECLDQVENGPLIISVAVSDVFVSIVVGSGAWHWRQLLSSDEYRNGAAY